MSLPEVLALYQALYRKYRPRCFRDVAGQEHVTETLRRQIVLGRLSHAYLFVGTRGTGKTTCAKILARAVNCRSPVDGEPCNKCASCIGIENGSILDVLELDAASNNGVDNVRALREEAIYTPASVLRRVYIVDEVHMLSTAAFNALLKILEEPPEHLVFILATTELHKVPATILSRCQRFSFKRISSAAIAERLKLVAVDEGIALTEDAAEKLAALADGSMRDGLSLLDQCASGASVDMARVLDTVGLAGQQELLRLADAVTVRDTGSALGIMDGLYNDGRDMASMLSELALLARDVLVYKLSADSPLLSGSFGRAEIAALSKKLPPERLFSFLEAIRESTFGLSRGGSVKLAAEMCLIKMCDERLSEDAPALLARIARLENADCGMQCAELTVSDIRQEPKDDSAQQYSERGEQGLPFTGPAQKLDSANTDNTARDKTETENSELLIPGSESEQAQEHAQEKETSPAPELDFWQKVLEQLKDNVPVYALISDSAKVQAQQQNGTLIIRAGNPYTLAQIGSEMFSEPIKEAAAKVLGREVIIRTEAVEGGDSVSKREKLESLAAFGIVSFE